MVMVEVCSSACLTTIFCVIVGKSGCCILVGAAQRTYCLIEIRVRLVVSKAVAGTAMPKWSSESECCSAPNIEIHGECVGAGVV